MDAATATRLVELAVEEAGGSRQVHGNPRHPFALNPTRVVEVEGETVLIRFGEASSPAIAELGDYVFEIRAEGLTLLFGPKRS